MSLIPAFPKYSPRFFKVFVQVERQLTHSSRYVKGIDQFETAIEFCTLAADRVWNNSALVDAYLSGLTDRLKDQLVSLDIPEELVSLVAQNNKIDRRLCDHAREKPCAHPSRPHSYQPVPPATSSPPRRTEPQPYEPVQLG